MIQEEQEKEIIKYITSNKLNPISTNNLRRRFRLKKRAINGFLSNHKDIEFVGNGEFIGSGRTNLSLWRLKGSDGKPHMKIQLINTSNL